MSIIVKAQERWNVKLPPDLEKEYRRLTKAGKHEEAQDLALDYAQEVQAPSDIDYDVIDTTKEPDLVGMPFVVGDPVPVHDAFTEGT